MDAAAGSVVPSMPVFMGFIPRGAVRFLVHGESMKEICIYAHPKCDSPWPTFFCSAWRALLGAGTIKIAGIGGPQQLQPVPAEIRALAVAANMVTISGRRELRWA